MPNQPNKNCWPASEIENIELCPFCDSKNKTLIFKYAEDWSFNAVEGQWQYWECIDCKTLYLNPRPKEAFIGKAYTNYYTHEKLTSNLSQGLKLRLKNQILEKKYKVSLRPGLALFFFIRPLLKFLTPYIYEPYGIAYLKSLPTGKLMDVGCGGGLMLSIAKQFGWDVTGLEFDAKAIKTANQKGLNVHEGGYKELDKFPLSFDVINCSHVLEHVHDPRDLLLKIKGALKTKGSLILTLPNSQSFLRKIYLSAWRGLEAPRHIAIPSNLHLVKYLQEIGFDVRCDLDQKAYTEGASKNIAKAHSVPIRKLNFDRSAIDTYNQDFSCIIAIKQ